MNAGDELFQVLVGCKQAMKCAIISRDSWYETGSEPIILKLNYTKADLLEFMSKMNFEYSDGYGSQELFETIWLADGTWLSRGEYDGSEWWVHNGLPEIPEACL